MGDDHQFVVFRLDGQRYALHLVEVERVVRAVAVTPLPQAPAGVVGLIQVQGRLLPVLDPRPRLGLPVRPIGPDDRFLLVQTAGRAAALTVDAVDGLLDLPAHAITGGASLLPGLDLAGAAQAGSEPAILLVDVDQFLPAAVDLLAGVNGPAVAAP